LLLNQKTLQLGQPQVFVLKLRFVLLDIQEISTLPIFQEKLKQVLKMPQNYVWLVLKPTVPYVKVKPPKILLKHVQLVKQNMN